MPVMTTNIFAPTTGGGRDGDVYNLPRHSGALPISHEFEEDRLSCMYLNRTKMIVSNIYDQNAFYNMYYTAVKF